MMRRAGIVMTTWVAVLFHAGAWADGCNDFKWDAAREQSLFAEKPAEISAGGDTASAPVVQTETLYDAALTQQEKVQFAAPPAKKMIADGASAGLLKFRVAQAGTYRVSLSQAFWIDVVSDGKMIPSLDFSGSHGCDRPRKIVVYELPASQELTLQLSGQVETHVLVSITAVSGKS